MFKIWCTILTVIKNKRSEVVVDFVCH